MRRDVQSPRSQPRARTPRREPDKAAARTLTSALRTGPRSPPGPRRRRRPPPTRNPDRSAKKAATTATRPAYSSTVVTCRRRLQVLLPPDPAPLRCHPKPAFGGINLAFVWSGDTAVVISAPGGERTGGCRHDHDAGTVPQPRTQRLISIRHLGALIALPAALIVADGCTSNGEIRDSRGSMPKAEAAAILVEAEAAIAATSIRPEAGFRCWFDRIPSGSLRIPCGPVEHHFPDPVNGRGPPFYAILQIEPVGDDDTDTTFRLVVPDSPWVRSFADYPVDLFRPDGQRIRP